MTSKIHVLLAMICPLALTAAVAVSPLPPSVYADTEVSTNVPLTVDFDRLDKFRFVFDLVETATNNFEVLLGCDVNGDGALSCEEALAKFGYDCGMWFERGCTVSVSDAVIAGGRINREVILMGKTAKPSWNLMRIVRRGVYESNETLFMKVENKRLILILK